MHCNFMFHLYCNFVSIIFTSKFMHLKLENIKKKYSIRVSKPRPTREVSCEFFLEEAWCAL